MYSEQEYFPKTITYLCRRFSDDLQLTKKRKQTIDRPVNYKNMNTKTKGYILGIIAAAAYGMNPLFALPLYKAGMNPDSVLFFRYLFAIPVLRDYDQGKRTQLQTKT